MAFVSAAWIAMHTAFVAMSGISLVFFAVSTDSYAFMVLLNVVLFAEAADGWRAYGQVLEHALALLGQGRCLAALARPDAADLLQAAHRHLKDLGARPPAAEASTLLARVLAT